MYDCNILPPSGASEVVLLDREPLALRCALLSAAASGLRLAEGDNSAAPRSAEEGNGPPCCSSLSSLEPEPLQGWSRLQQQHREGRQQGAGGGASLSSDEGQQQQQQQREGQQEAGGGALQFSDVGGAQVAAEAVSQTLQRVISGVERATAGAASGGTGSAVVGGSGAASPSAGSDGEAPRRSGGTSDPSRAEAAAAEAAPVFPTLVCPVTGALRLPEFRFEGAAAISRLVEGQLPSSSSEGQQGPGGSSGSGATGAAEGDWISSSSVKGDPAGSSTEGSSRNGVMRARVFDWNHADLLGEQYNVLLACDVLYEDAAVGPIAALVPRWADETSRCTVVVVPRGHGLGFRP